MASKKSAAERLAAIRERFPQATEAQAKLIERRHGRFNAAGEFVRTAEHGTANVQQLPGGREVATTNSAQAAERILNDAAKAGKRVSVEVWDKDHPVGKSRPLHAWENVRRPHNPGWSAKGIKDELKKSGKTLRQYLTDQVYAEPGDDTEGEAVRANGITAIQITVY